MITKAYIAMKVMLLKFLLNQTAFKMQTSIFKTLKIIEKNRNLILIFSNKLNIEFLESLIIKY
jgi:hypothetical protein